MQAFGAKHDSRPYRSTYRFLRGDPAQQAKPRDELTDLKKSAEAGDLVLFEPGRSPVPDGPDAHRHPRGERPPAGRRDVGLQAPAVRVRRCQPGKAAIHANLLDSPKDAKAKIGKSKPRRLQMAFAAHLGTAAASSQPPITRGWCSMDNAMWHAGELMRAALEENPNLDLKRLLNRSPQLSLIERFWKLLRRRATPNRLFDTLADLRQSIRSSLSSFQTMQVQVKTMLDRRTNNWMKSTGS